jgi:hypothetical protein
VTAVLELGRHLVSEFEEPEQADTLSKWMAHYLAEQILAAKAARGKARDTLQGKCADLILKLWAQRHALPRGRRPLEAFEPAMQTLEQLRSDQPRYFVLHDTPDTKKLPEPAKSFLSIALTIDRASSAIIQYCLAESVSQIPKKDRRWLKLIKAVESSHPADVTLIIEMMSASDDLTVKKDHVTAAAIKTIEQLHFDLDKLQEVAEPIRQHFEARIGYLKNGPKS